MALLDGHMWREKKLRESGEKGQHFLGLYDNFQIGPLKDLSFFCHYDWCITTFLLSYQNKLYDNFTGFHHKGGPL